MGASASGELGPLAVAAVAETTQFDANHLRTLKQLFLNIVKSRDDDTDAGDDAPHASQYRVQHERRREPNLSREQFQEALKSVDFFSSDVAIFSNMFTLLDRTGDEAIFAHEFLVGVCALLQGDLATKLQVALELLHESPESITHDDLVFVLHTMNQTATYFGDPAIMRKTLVSIVEDVFAPKDAPSQETEQQDKLKDNPAESLMLSDGDVAARVVEHPLVDQYIRGQTGAPANPLLHPN